MNEIILEMKNIEKSFSGVPVLKSAHFDLRRGEIHALMGENGAGKSTLMKILTGIYKEDSGEIICFNKRCDFQSVKDSQNAKIAIIHQELNQVKDLTVAQNLFLGREKIQRSFFIDDKKMVTEAEKILKTVGANINPKEILKNLTVGKQQMVEIAKAISQNSEILILDEPTTALSNLEVEELFRIMQDLKDKGIGMIYISHRMDEIKKISDRITIMRDGEYICTKNTNEISDEEIVRLMVGRELIHNRRNESFIDFTSPNILEVKNLNVNNKLSDISFSLKKGEILGIAGLMGAGRTELAKAIYGVDKLSSGEIFVNGEKVNFKSPKDAVKRGVCYLSEDRKRFGLLLDKSVIENTILANLESYIKYGFINDKKAKREAKNKNALLKTKTSSMKEKVKNLSGGNQQKVILARWLLKNAEIFIFDEATKGVDVGAKSEIYDLIRELAKKGKAIILISSEISEIQSLSNRVLVMCEGKVTGELSIEEATNEKIMEYAMKGANANDKA